MSGHVVKIVIENTKPPIWRRIVLPEKIQFDDLHKIIQMTFGWKDRYDHEFSFPYGNLRIVPSPNTNSYRMVAEDYVIYEDYLEQVNWIRYKYNSREAIKHKIIYEKLDPTYKHRYATILKAKGDDHKGLEYISYYEEENLEAKEFSMDHVNTMLENFIVPKRKSKLKMVELSREKKLEEEIERISEEIIRYKEQLEKFEKSEVDKQLQIGKAFKKKSTSKTRLAIEEWEAFADLKLEGINSSRGNKLEYLNNEDESQELSRNQTTLFGEDSVREDVNDKHIKIIFPKEKCEILLNKPSKSMRQYLNQLSAKEVQMHSKFLQPDVGKKANKNEMLDCMEVLLKKIPEYYLWAFSKEEWRALEKLATFNEGEALPNIDTDSVTKAISVGLLDCKILKRNNNYSVTFTFAIEMKDILKIFNQKKSENLFRLLEKLDEALKSNLAVYGMMDLESLYTAFKKFRNNNITYTEFKRLVYWRGIFLGYLITFDNLIDGKSYAAAPQIDYDLATILRDKYMDEKPYRIYDKRSLMELYRGFNLFYSSWQLYLEYLDLTLRSDEETISQWIPEAYLRVLNGTSSTEVIKSSLEIYEPRNILEYRELWYTLFYAVMETGLVGLKGYSREEYLEMGNKFPKLLPAVTNKKDVVKIGRATHIYEMSQDIQLEVFNLSFTEIAEAITGMTTLINRYGNTNEELKLILAEMYDINGDFKEAKRVLLEIKLGSKKQDFTIDKLIFSVNERIISDDFDLNYADEDMAKYINNVVQFPSKKISKDNIKEVKIGRNDPCPCGSGKKYKNCCGK